MNVSVSIKNLRERHDMTQEQFGKIAGVSAMAVSQWENGRAVPRMGAIQRISDFFGIPKSEVIGDTPNVSSIRTLSELEAAAYKKYSVDEYELLHLFNLLSPYDQDWLLETTRRLAELRQFEKRK